MNKGGRPTKYSKKIAIKICQRISSGESVRTICKDKKLPCAATVFFWLLDDDKKWFLEQYETARNTQAENMFEELLDIADNDDGDVQRARLRIDTRKWYLSKVLPKKFGDKTDLTSGGKPIPLMNINALLRDDSDTQDSETEE